MESTAAVATCRLRGQFDLTFGFEWIHAAAHTEDIGGHGVSGRVVGSHGTGGIGHADPLYGPGIIRRHGLALDHRNPLHAEDFSGHGRAAAQDPAPTGVPAPTSLTSLMAASASPNAAIPASMATAMVAPHLDGIQAEIVIQAIHHGDGVQIVDAAVAAVGPHRFVLGLFA